jgi:CSLREA domain-containing protein
MKSTTHYLTIFLLLLGFLFTFQPMRATQAAPLNTITVTTTADEYASGAGCSLREAIVAANTDATFFGCPAGSGTDVINVPAGTYTLSRPNSGGLNEDDSARGDLDINTSLTIQGAGAGLTIIDGGAIDKVIAANPACYLPISVTIDGVTIRNGRNTQAWGVSDFSFTGGGIDWCGYGSGNFTLRNAVVENNVNVNGYGGGLNTDSASGYNGIINLNNVTFQNNSTLGTTNQESNGGGLNLLGHAPTVSIQNCSFLNNTVANPVAVGGGMYLRLRFGSSIQIHNTLVDGNSSGGMGGGIYTNFQINTTALRIDQNTRITNNISGNASGGTGGGSGIAITGNALTITPATLSKIVVTGNSESALATTHNGGGGIWVGAANVTISYSRISANTLVSGSGTGLFKNTFGGVVNASNNWWGCSSGPSAAPCDTAVLEGGSSGSLTSTPYLRVVTSATPTSLAVNETSAVTASVRTNSDGTDVAANIERLIGLPVAWSATTGSLSAQQLTIQAGGTATATFTGTQVGDSTVSATVGADATSVNLTVNQIPLAVLKSSGCVASNCFTVAADALNALQTGGNLQISGGFPLSAPLTVTRDLVISNETGGALTGPAGSAAVQLQSGNLVVKGITISGGTQPFEVNGGSLVAYGNNLTGYAQAVQLNAGSASLGHNWWGDYNDAGRPTNLSNADWNSRLGASVQHFVDGSGSVSLSDALAGANAELSGNGTLVLVSHGSGLAAVPFGKGTLEHTQNACAEYYDFFVLGGSGDYTLLLPVKTGPCATYAETRPAFFHFLLDGGGATQPTCDPLANCWVRIPATYNSTDRQLSATVSVDLLHGTPFSTPNEAGKTPTAVQLFNLEARPGHPTGWIWLAPLASIAVGLWKLQRRQAA